jgi:hypothetical protein
MFRQINAAIIRRITAKETNAVHPVLYLFILR